MINNQLDLARVAHVAIVQRTVKKGDLLTHKRCMGCIEEHTFVGLDGPWLSGRATSTTVRLGGYRGVTNDIAPCNVTHINRVPVEAVEFLAEVASNRMVHSASGARPRKNRRLADFVKPAALKAAITEAIASHAPEHAANLRRAPMSDVHNGTEQKTNCVAWFAGRIDGLDAAIAIADQLMDRGTSTGEAIAEVRNRIERMRLSTKADHARLGAK